MVKKRVAAHLEMSWKRHIPINAGSEKRGYGDDKLDCRASPDARRRSLLFATAPIGPFIHAEAPLPLPSSLGNDELLFLSFKNDKDARKMFKTPRLVLSF